MAEKTQRRRAYVVLASVATLVLTALVLPDAYTRVVDRIGERRADPITSAAWPQDVRIDDYSSQAPTFVIPQRPETITLSLDRADTQDAAWDQEAWAEKLGGVHANLLAVDFSLQAGTDRPVVLTGVRVRVLHRRPPLQGAFMRPAGGGDLWERALQVDLDEDPPRHETWSHTLENPEWTFPISLGQADTTLLTVLAGTSEHDVDWVIDVDYVFGGRKGTHTIDDGGKPFRVTSSAASTQCFLVQDGAPLWDQACER